MAYRILVASLLVVLVALGATGCQRAVERAVEGATGVSVDEDEQRIAVTGEDGEEFTMDAGGTSLPDEWPSDVPIYPDMQLESSLSMRMGESTQLTATWKSTDDVNDIFEWYRAELPSAGWEVEGEFSIEQSGERTANISSSKGEVDANVFIGDQEGATGVTIQVRTE